MDYAALKTHLTTDPYAVGFAGPLAKRSDAELARLGNDRSLAKQTLPVATAPTAAALMPLISPVGLEKILNSGLASRLTDALKAGDAPGLGIMVSAFQAVGWITAAEASSLAAKLGAASPQPASAFEKAGIVPYGGLVSVDQVSAALNAK